MDRTGVATVLVVGVIIAAAVLVTPFIGSSNVPAAGTGAANMPAPGLAKQQGAAPTEDAPSALLEGESGSGRASASPQGDTRGLTLAEIFEMSESSVVRVNVQRVSDPAGGGIGSGFIYDKDGHIVTNEHVVSGAQQVTVTFLDGRSYGAQVVGADVYSDLAVIRVSADPSLLIPLALGDSSVLTVGESVTAIGNPFGLSGSMTSGIVSQLGRLLSSDGGFSIPDIIQTDAAINPGNSGGPLLNMKGEVVGVNTAIQSNTGQFTGIGFAVPSNTVSKIAPGIIADGLYRHPWMGITGTDVSPALAEIMNLDDAVGFLVYSVVEGSPAEVAGLMGSQEVMVDGTSYLAGGDVIVAVDGVDVRKIDDILVHLQREKSVGDTMTVDILRGGQELRLTLILQERPDTPVQ